MKVLVVGVLGRRGEGLYYIGDGGFFFSIGIRFCHP
jgi:hypothetical protein